MNSSPNQWSSLHQGRLSAMIEVADAAGRDTLKYFRSESLTVDAKSDDSPVTVADREAEQLVRKLLLERFPDDSIHGEEFDDQAGSSRYRWVVDPIDGTKSFVCGVPLYSTLLALELDGQPLGGVIFIPPLDEVVVAAIGQGAWTKWQGGDWQAATVSDRSTMEEAIFVTTQVDTFDLRSAGDVYRQIEQAAWVTRSWGDGYGYLLVATGRADIMIDPLCNPWDVAAILPVVCEAGGKFTDWRGNPTVRGGDGVGTNGKLHNAVLAKLK
jgi:histidinol phosphatase-like enzyme (inositol monophosphatase family)